MQGGALTGRDYFTFTFFGGTGVSPVLSAKSGRRPVVTKCTCNIVSPTAGGLVQLVGSVSGVVLFTMGTSVVHSAGFNLDRGFSASVSDGLNLDVGGATTEVFLMVEGYWLLS